MKNTSTFTSPLLSTDVDSLHEWICWHPYFFNLPDKVLSIIFQSFRKAEIIHQNDFRSDGELYIGHPIQLVLSMIETYPNEVNFHDIIVLILHDTIEDHPECWQDIVNQFGLHIFRDVLILSKLTTPIRAEILEWFAPQFDKNNPTSIDILHILSPSDPADKFERFSTYTGDLLGKNSIRFKNALLLYKKEIIDKDKNKIEADDEYISLGNYLYFQPKDARRKLQDMLHNMSDMHAMEIKKPGYIEKRRIKAYILGVKLRNFEMTDDYEQLEYAFQGTGHRMYTDEEVSQHIS